MHRDHGAVSHVEDGGVPTRGPATTRSPLGTSLESSLRSVSARPLPTGGGMAHVAEAGPPGGSRRGRRGSCYDTGP